MDHSKKYSQKNIIMGKELGEGAFGVVLSGYLKEDGEKIAIKRVKKEIINKYGEYLKQAFYKELESMKKCNCENSVNFYFYFETQNNYNIVMELCDGDLNKELNKRPNGFCVNEIRYIMSQLNNAFKKMTSNNIIHRDLKIGNILIKYTDETKKKFIPKLCDYGFSKVLKDSDVAFTHLGTPATMAPEIMERKSYDAKADLWSVGVLIYQLHFNDIPYHGNNEKEIYSKIKNQIPYKKAEDPILRDLIDHLLVENPLKRYSWQEYFEHPFFKIEEKEKNDLPILTKKEIKKEIISENNNNYNDSDHYRNNDNNKMNQNDNNNILENNEELKYIGNGKKYIYKKDFDVGYINDIIKCSIALYNKNNKLYFIKSYRKESTNSRPLIFNMEYHFFKSNLKNNNILQLKNVQEEEQFIHLIFAYDDFEILPNYIENHEFNENELKNMTKELITNVFGSMELKFNFIFVSPYSFVINKEGKPIIIDIGINRDFLPPEEVKFYYKPNESEFLESAFPVKTNIMNYGITLLKCFYGNNLKLNIEKNEIILPCNKNISNCFKKFMEKCLKTNIMKRSSWIELYDDDFIKSLNTIKNESINNQNIYEPLISDKKMKGILRAIDTKYKLINNYYNSLEINANTPFLNEIEYFLILTLFEQLIVLDILKNSQKNKKFSINQEISFLSINGNQVEEVRINFSELVFENMKIFNNNDFIQSIIPKFENHAIKLKQISLRIHKITKSNLFKQNYINFLKNFCSEEKYHNFINYFGAYVKEANKDWFLKKYESCKNKAPIAEYLCEIILFKETIMEDFKLESVNFQRKQLIDKFNKIFEKEDENNIQVSCIKLNEEKDKYILVSFLGMLFKYMKNFVKNNQVPLPKILSAYQDIIKILVDRKEIK